MFHGILQKSGFIPNRIFPKYDPNDYVDLPQIAKDIAHRGMMPTTDWAIKNGEEIYYSSLFSMYFFVDHQWGNP